MKKSRYKEEQIIGILLAAGQSTRFGQQDKLMYQLPSGASVALQSAKNLHAATTHTLAVLRAENITLASQLQALGINPIYRNDGLMADSLKAAISVAMAMPVAPKGFLIALADMPYIRAETIQKIIQALEAEDAIIIPSYLHQRGHPVAFPARFASALMTLTGDQGAKSMIEKYSDEVVLIECGDAGILQDIDTLADIR